ncbi:uncharacterized protein LOC144142311 isoform X2 [Haemaphysalis longicornis]
MSEKWWRKRLSLAPKKRRARNMGESSIGGSSEQNNPLNRVRNGRAVPIVYPNDDGGFELDEGALRRILLGKDVANKPVVVVSIAGAFRKGKSFLLNFFLRYMRSEGKGDWLGCTSTPLEGFSWSGGIDRHTTGILLWDEVFLVTRTDGSQVAVLLMDTQGAFDTYTTVNDVATIFALSTMTSSVQVYNLSQNIQEDDLQHLQFFTEYGRMAQQHDGSHAPFQKLVFLVRDWAHVSDAQHGAQGGQNILNKRLDTSGRDNEQEILRRLIKSSFSELGCFLMPYPGRQVATGQPAEGCLPDMEEDFKHHLREFVESLLGNDKLVTKRINGTEVSCKEWVKYFSKYAKIFSGNELPKLKTVLEVTADVDNMMALEKAKETYLDGMEKACGPDQPYLDIPEFTKQHILHKNAAITFFESLPKMGGDVYSLPYVERLLKEVQQSYSRFIEINHKKRPRPAFTPSPFYWRMPTSDHATFLDALVEPVYMYLRLVSKVVDMLLNPIRFGPDMVENSGNSDSRQNDCAEEAFADYTRYLQQMHLRTEEDEFLGVISPSEEYGIKKKGVEIGRPVKILGTNDDHNLELDIEALSRILLADDVKDKPVVVVSVAGALAKDKSFLLKFLLQYMHCGGQDDWMDDTKVALGGLFDREGGDGDATGVMLWNQVFSVTTSQGQELAVLFMYTQGTCDGVSAMEDCAKSFTLSTVTSSVQVYSVSQNITEDDLQNLQLCIDEFERLVKQGKSDKPFQKLMFLVRDWCDPYDAPYGAEGGQIILDRRLQISEGQLKELQQLRSRIHSYFTEIGCFLMRSPGPKVATSTSFDGPLSDIEDDFKKQLQDFVSCLLAPENLLVKKINGKEISCQDLMTYFLLYVTALEEQNLPEPGSVLEDTAEASAMEAVTSAKELYTGGMEQVCGEDQPFLSGAMLEHHHLELRESAMERFSAMCMDHDEEISQQYLDRLTEEIDRAFESFATCNKRKEVLAAARTLAKLCALVLAFYMVSWAFTLVGLHSVASLGKLLFGLSVARLVFWNYTRYSGRVKNVRADIDTIKSIFLDRLQEHLYESAMRDRAVLPHLTDDEDEARRPPPNFRSNTS